MVSMHLLVLSAFRQEDDCRVWAWAVWSQCTFWCSVLSDAYFLFNRIGGSIASLNAPSGAQCFPTEHEQRKLACRRVSQCTFWCSVLSDKTPATAVFVFAGLNAPSGAQCFPTPCSPAGKTGTTGLNAPSGAQCFPTGNLGPLRTNLQHGLNAPSGAQCFPTR